MILVNNSFLSILDRLENVERKDLGRKSTKGVLSTKITPQPTVAGKPHPFLLWFL